MPKAEKEKPSVVRVAKMVQIHDNDFDFCFPFLFFSLSRK